MRLVMAKGIKTMKQKPEFCNMKHTRKVVRSNG